ncbi:hypothetical protein GYMLUDRAFT_34285 [Collybiopsis luxurians FD-317 M1]|nr:hypothetical protein GYMLUDRAFT_34285 [Collybiopsis luxurians FD-317 M1]
MVTISVPKSPVKQESNTLSSALQYSTGTGSSVLTSFFREFTARVMRPAYADWQVLMHSGNTDGWNKVVNLLCETNDYILVEEHTFSSAQALWAPICKGMPVKVDHEGLIPQSLEKILGEWDMDHPGERRPHLIYTNPVGQNPTGATMGLERKKQIYEICVKYDLIICEDDPYYFLQLPDYVLPSQRGLDYCLAKPVTEDEFIGTLVPSFLAVDYQGRVIRLETFSKTLGPGNRLGYFVCNPVFAERLFLATEVTSQSASGWSQAIIEQLIASQWGQNGLLRWMMGIQNTYTIRRDWMCDFLAETFDLVSSGNKNAKNELMGVVKGSGSEGLKKPCFSFTPPKAGMFIWIKLYPAHTTLFETLQTAGETDVEAKWSELFWASLIEEKVLLAPGYFYSPIIGPNQRAKPESGVIFFRLAYCFENKEEIRLGIGRIGRVFEKYWDSKM